MPKLLNLRTFADNRGWLSVVEDKELPFAIRRFFYLYNIDNSIRGGHRHKLTYQALICLQGSCRVYVNDGEKEYNVKSISLK